jgi:putative ABC transport system substrate-binding protein
LGYREGENILIEYR